MSADFSRVTGALDSGLWSSAGLTQDYGARIFDQDMQLAGSSPHAGVSWMRPHDLLNLVGATGLDTDRPAYDWRRLDRALDTIRAADLTPLFELMGNPSGRFTSFLDRGQLFAWKRMVGDLARHLESRYGAADVRGWLFESWNEPDINFGWKWRTPVEHQNYYDACSEGLREADPLLKLGGPGVTSRQMPLGPFLESFLSHCDTGANYFTGGKGVRLDFISVHCKKTPSAMVDAEVENMNRIIREHPGFAHKLFLNDEADSEVGWSRKDLPFRATPWYAAFIARSVDEHILRIVDGRDIIGGQRVEYRMSNDDAFWGPWVFRTQFAQFGDDSRFALIGKPSHAVRTALSLLAGRRCAVTGADRAGGVGAIATTDGSLRAAVLVYNYADRTDAAGVSRVRIEFGHLPFASGKWAHYRIDANHGDTHREWLAMGSPARPTDGQIEILRRHDGLGLCEPISDAGGPSLSRTFDLPLPGVSVIVVCADPGPGGAPITGLRADAYASLSGANEDVVIRWTGGPRLVKTYEVLCGPAREGPFRRVNFSDRIEAGFVYQRPPGFREFAKVRAIDYWDRPAGESGVIELPSAR